MFSETELATMLEHIVSQDIPDFKVALADTDPETALLARALADCRHPKAGRLLARLSQNPDANARVQLRADIFQLLVLAFGKAEALRRLQ